MFRLFEGPTADHVWQQLAQAFREAQGVRVQPSRGGPTKEVLHAAISVADPRQRWVVSRQPPINVAFAIADIVWIMTGRNDLAFLEAWNKQLRNFVGPGPMLHGAYGYRIRHHLGLDQLVRAYEALGSNPDTRQVVLQIWDSSIDLPLAKGKEADVDIPCNVMSLLKLRDGKLEWLQIIRSNDLFRGVPYNFVQFTFLQEILAGWLNIECGAYQQISDSLHLYESDEADVMASNPLAKVHSNADSLSVPRDASEWAFSELEHRVEQMIRPELRQEVLEGISVWSGAPQAFQNMLAVLVAEAARRRRWVDMSAHVMSSCTNPVYVELWNRWIARVSPMQGQQHVDSNRN